MRARSEDASDPTSGSSGFRRADVSRASIQYDYESLAALEQANEKRNADARWGELNQALMASGFTVTFSGIAYDITEA